jgi:carbonic anhydrase/acetyltransferase-like protein (isoleucine patch superfamily)
VTAGPGERPRIHPTAFVAPTASVMGDVTLGPDSSVWYGAVLRGDMAPIVIGGETNLQDGTIVHVMREPSHRTVVGDDVTVGHGVVLHGCTVGHRCLIGMGAILLNGSVVGEESIVAAGTLLPEGMIVPPGSLVMGSPGKVRRPLTGDEIAFIRQSATNYVQYRLDYLE